MVDPLLAVAIFAELAEERPRGGADDAHELSERLASLEENAPLMIMLRLRDVVEPEDAERDLVTVAGGSSGTRSARRPELLVTLAPAGLETFFAEVGSPVGPGERKPTEMTIDVEEMNRRGERHGVEFVGPPPTLDD